MENGGLYGGTEDRIKDDADVGGWVTGSEMAVVSVYTIWEADNYSGRSGWWKDHIGVKSEIYTYKDMYEETEKDWIRVYIDKLYYNVYGT